MSRLSVSVLVPAFNEEAGLGDTLDALVGQTYPPREIIVVDDCSTDGTAEVAWAYPEVTVVKPPANLGSKAKAQNFGLDYCDGDLVLPVDADTILAPDYIEKIVEPFEDEKVAIAAGCVLTRHTKTWTERGRSIEYAFGFHFYRPVQNQANSPVVCSGCCSAFRRDMLLDFGGFPERTIVEDMDYTWSQQIAGRRAVYVGNAVAYAADPENLTYLRKQVKRWMAGFFQNVRLHVGWPWRSRSMVRAKPMLALWVLLAVFEILTAPAWYASPVVAMWLFDMGLLEIGKWWLGAELLLVLPPLIYAAIRRKISVWVMLINIPFVYAMKIVNIVYSWRGLVCELTPLRRRYTLVTYEKGR